MGVRFWYTVRAATDKAFGQNEKGQSEIIKSHNMSLQISNLAPLPS